MENLENFTGNIPVGTVVAASCRWPDDPHGNMTIWKSEAPDANLQDIIHGFYTTLIGLTFSPQTVINGMAEFVAEHSDYEFHETEEN